MSKVILMIIALIVASSTVDAAKIDAYREILANGSYTIRYNNLTPIERVTNRDVVDLYGRGGLLIDKSDFFINRPLNGMITSDGDNRYEEVGYQDFYQCQLLRGGENYIFTRYKNKKGNIEYFGSKKGKVEANSRNYLAELIAGESFGDDNFTEMINAIIADSDKSADMVKYKFINAGDLDNGLSFEDFLAQEDNIISAIRYYFEGDTLVKIAYASYGRDSNGNFRGSKCIVKVLEFSGAADKNLLKLPDGLKDETKR